MQVADSFAAYMQPVLTKEGGGKLTNNPADRGGPTIWGVTETRARAAGFTGPMASMTMDTALQIYRLFYWTQPAFDRLAESMPTLGMLMLDLGINCGTGTVGKMLQRALNGLNAGRAYPALTVDGNCGAITRAALVAYRTRRPGEEGDDTLLSLVRAQVAVHYLEIEESDPSQAAFLFGWLSKRAFA